jgi:hypothetical protein
MRATHAPHACALTWREELKAEKRPAILDAGVDFVDDLHPVPLVRLMLVCVCVWMGGAHALVLLAVRCAVRVAAPPQLLLNDTRGVSCCVVAAASPVTAWRAACVWPQ